jgi:hypothetical protein
MHHENFVKVAGSGIAFEKSNRKESMFSDSYTTPTLCYVGAAHNLRSRRPSTAHRTSIVMMLAPLQPSATIIAIAFFMIPPR